MGVWPYGSALPLPRWSNTAAGLLQHQNERIMVSDINVQIIIPHMEGDILLQLEKILGFGFSEVRWAQGGHLSLSYISHRIAGFNAVQRAEQETLTQ